jgi:hypothetical protein
MEKIAAELPAGFGFEWTEIALQEKVAGNTAGMAFCPGRLDTLLRCTIFSGGESAVGHFLPPRLLIGMAGLAPIVDAE